MTDEVKELGLDEYYQLGSEIGHHPRVRGQSLGLAIGQRHKQHDEDFRLCFYDVEHVGDASRILALYLECQLVVLEKLPSSLPHLADKDTSSIKANSLRQQLDEFVRRFGLVRRRPPSP